MSLNKALLLVGSPRGTHSTSYSVGAYLGDRLVQKGYEQDVKVLYDYISDESKLPELIDAINSSDFITLAFPLYIDTFPAGIISIMEHIARERKKDQNLKQPRFFCIVNSGYPEKQQSNNVILSTKLFADRCKFKWYGNIVIGGGPLIDGKKVNKLGLLGSLIKTMNLISESIAKGDESLHPDLSKQAKLLISKTVYVPLVQLVIRVILFKKHKLKELNSSPYL